MSKMRCSLLAMAIALAAFLVSSATLRADDEPSIETATPAAQAENSESDTPPATPLPESLPDDAGPAPDAGGDDDAPPKKTELPPRVIYIPFKDFKAAYDNDDSNVVLPYSEYLKLLRNWEASQQPHEEANAVVVASSYTVSVEKDVARIEAQLVIDVFEDRWTEVPIRFGSAAVGTVEGDDVLMRGLGDGNYALLFQKAGQHEVRLELSTRVRQSPDGRDFEFSVPSVAVTTLEVSIPEPDQNVVVKPQLVQQTVADAPEGTTVVRSQLGSTQSIAVHWHPLESRKPEMDLLSSVTNATAVTFADGLIHTDAYLTYDVLRGQLNQVQIFVPAGHRVLDVSADVRVSGWKVSDEKEHQLLTVDLLQAAAKPVTIEVHTERKLENGDVSVIGVSAAGAVDGIHAVDAVRESGQLVIRGNKDLTITVLEQSGLIRIEDAEIVERLKGNQVLAFKYYSPETVLRLSVKAVEPRLVVSQQTRIILREEELYSRTQVNYDIQRAGVFDLRFKIPEGLKIDAVHSPQMTEYAVDTGASLLTISLNGRTQGQVAVTIEGRQPWEDAPEPKPVPLIEPLDVERETGAVFIFARESMEVLTDQGGIESAQPLSTRPNETVVDAVFASAWSYTRRPVTIPIRTVRKPTRLSSHVATTVHLRPEVTEVRTNLDFDVEFAGIDTFRVSVPESISDRLQIELADSANGATAIKQRTAGESVDGWTTWTITMQREVLGRQRFLLTYDLPIAAADDEETDGPMERALSVQMVQPLGLTGDDDAVTVPLSRVDGEIAVLKEKSLAVAAEATGGEVEPIDPRELKRLSKDAALAYRYFGQPEDTPITLSVTLTRHEIQEVVSTVISRALVEIVTGEDAEATYRSRLRIKSTERQRLLVHLPVDAEILAVAVNEREVQLEKADVPAYGDLWTPYWVNVSRPQASDVEFLLSFHFLWKVSPTIGESTFARGEIALPLLVLGSDEAAAAVQHLKVAVWVPRRYVLVGNPPDFQILNSYRDIFSRRPQNDAAALESWIRPPSGITAPHMQFPTEGRVLFTYSNLGGADVIDLDWWHFPMMTAVLSGTIVLIGLILLRTSWENKLGVVLLGAFIAVLYGIQDPHGLQQGLIASWVGIVVLFVLWIVHSLFGRRPEPTRPAPPLAEIPPARYAVVPPPGVFEMAHGKSADRSS